MNKDVKIQCPNCEIKKGIIVYCGADKQGTFHCEQCGSTYASNVSAKQVREELLKARENK